MLQKKVIQKRTRRSVASGGENRSFHLRIYNPYSKNPFLTFLPKYPAATYCLSRK